MAAAAGCGPPCDLELFGEVGVRTGRSRGAAAHAARVQRLRLRSLARRQATGSLTRAKLRPTRRDGRRLKRAVARGARLTFQAAARARDARPRTNAPRLTLTGRLGQRVAAQRGVSVTAQCDRRCALTLTAKTRVGRRRIVLRSRPSIALPANRRVSIKLRPSRRSLRVIRQARGAGRRARIRLSGLARALPGADALRIRVEGRVRQRLLAQRGAVVSVTCDEACSLTATGALQVVGGGRTISLRGAGAQLGADSRRRLRLRLSRRDTRAVERLLAAGRRLTLIVRVRATGTSGRTGAEARRLGLRAR